VRDALATLPWVESSSIEADRGKRQVKFTVTDREKFDFQEVKKLLDDKGYGSGVKVLAGPTDP
jgi:hypothetical protein